MQVTVEKDKYGGSKGGIRRVCDGVGCMVIYGDDDVCYILY